MPIREYVCHECHQRETRIELAGKCYDPLTCVTCTSRMTTMISAPASFRFPDMSTLRRKRERIKEPVWRDLETGKLTAANP